MIQSLQIATRSRQDLEVLMKLLEALGAGKSSLERKNVAHFRPRNLELNLVNQAEGRPADLVLAVEDLDSAAQVVRQMKIEVIETASRDADNPDGTFTAHLPSGTEVKFVPGFSAGPDNAGLAGSLSATGKRFGIVVSRFNAFITERLLTAAIDALVRCGADPDQSIDVIRVPGAFEIPTAARALAETKNYDAILCVGCLLRGDTAHYDVIANEVTRGIGQSAQETGVPHAFGVLTCDTLEQAIDRAGLKAGNKGFEAALAAVEMASLTEEIRSQASNRKKALPASHTSSNKSTNTQPASNRKSRSDISGKQRRASSATSKRNRKRKRV